MGVLEEIVARTRADLSQRMTLAPEAELRRGLTPSDRSLEESLRAPRTGFILECKKASPSQGLLRDPFDPAELARAYAWGADGISVLTDGPFFQGSHAYLRAVREAVPQPVLCKDFLVDPYQVVEARAHGADAVLLMLSVLDDDGWSACQEVADELGMDTLTEVHDEQELTRAVGLGASIVGINNRDLKTLSVDLATCERLAPRVPAGVVRVAESGVFTTADVRRLRPHVDAFLVGTSLMTQLHVDRATRALIVGRFKVCGLTRAADAESAWQSGATWGGLIFAPESPRAVGAAEARAIRDGAPLAWVGVFVNEDPLQVAALATDLGLRAVQLHGEEDRAYVQRLRPLLPSDCEVWKAIRVREELPTREATGADRLLLDAYDAGQRGGTGRRFDWSLLAGRADRGRLILSGGITPENAAQAAALGTWALDVNSGVESAPGHKSAERLAALRDALRGEGRT